MAEWHYEAGIGEERAILVENGAIRAARVDWGEGLRAELVADVRLIVKAAGARRGTVRFVDGTEALVDALPGDITEGATVRVRITRAAIAEGGRTKLAQTRTAPNEALRAAPTLLETLRVGPAPVHETRIAASRFDECGWSELVEQALSGEIAFTGGVLTVSPTPAMTLIDVDGTGAPATLALSAAPVVAAALARLDLGGSVGVDFPTLAEKRERQAVDAVLSEALRDWRGERTAMNGFGFVQLVSRLERPSLVALYARRAEAAARILLRQAERVSEPGALQLTASPAVRRTVRPEWEAELARRTGRVIVWREEPGLATLGMFAQAVAS